MILLPDESEAKEDMEEAIQESTPPTSPARTSGMVVAITSDAPSNRALPPAEMEEALPESTETRSTSPEIKGEAALDIPTIIPSMGCTTELEGAITEHTSTIADINFPDATTGPSDQVAITIQELATTTGDVVSHEAEEVFPHVDCGVIHASEHVAIEISEERKEDLMDAPAKEPSGYFSSRFGGLWQFFSRVWKGLTSLFRRG